MFPVYFVNDVRLAHYPPPLLDITPLTRASVGLEPTCSGRCPAHTTSLSATLNGPTLDQVQCRLWPSRAISWRVPRHRTGLPVLRPSPSSMRAAAITPAEPAGACVTRFPTGASLPRFRGGSASALHVSGPARRSLVLRLAGSPSRPWRPVASECFRRCRYLHHPLRLLPAGATVAGRDSHPLKNGALHGARKMHGKKR